MKKRSLTLAMSGESIVAIGLVALVGVGVVALFADLAGLNTTPVSPVQSQPAASVVGMTTVPGAGPVTAQMIPVAATVQPDAGTTVRTTPKPGLILLQNAPRINFSGTIQQITEQPQSDGQLHVWVQDAQGLETRISVGPGWFLQYLGCELAHDIPLSGSGFTFQQTGRNPLVYARKIVVNGKTCQLRNDEGFALWSNKLR